MWTYVGRHRKKWLLPVFIAITVASLCLFIFSKPDWALYYWSVRICILSAFVVIVLVGGRTIVAFDNHGNILVPGYAPNRPNMMRTINRPCYYIIPDVTGGDYRYLFSKKHIESMERIENYALIGGKYEQVKITFTEPPVLLKNVRKGVPEFDTTTKLERTIIVDIDNYKDFQSKIKNLKSY